jgi:hypothetical protein
MAAIVPRLIGEDVLETGLFSLNRSSVRCGILQPKVRMKLARGRCPQEGPFSSSCDAFDLWNNGDEVVRFRSVMRDDFLPV